MEMHIWGTFFSACQELEGFREKLKQARKFGKVGCWDLGYPWLEEYGSSKAKLYKRVGLLLGLGSEEVAVEAIC